MAKKKVIVAVDPNAVDDQTLAEVAAGLQRRFGPGVLGADCGFTFALEGDTSARRTVVAEGPWELPANQRPALPTMQTFAEGYLAALQSVSWTPAASN